MDRKQLPKRETSQLCLSPEPRTKVFNSLALERGPQEGAPPLILLKQIVGKKIPTKLYGRKIQMGTVLVGHLQVL